MTDEEKEEFKILQDWVFELRGYVISLLSRVENLEREMEMK